MINNLLAKNDIIMYVILGVLVVLLIVYYVISSRNAKKRREQNDVMMKSALTVGVEILTIGGIRGTIVEINETEGTFVIETGSESNKSYMKFDRVALHSIVSKNEEAGQTPGEPFSEMTEPEQALEEKEESGDKE